MEASKHCGRQMRDGRAVCQRLRELLKAFGRINRSTSWDWKRAHSSRTRWYRDASCVSGTRLAAMHAKLQSRPCQSCLSTCEFGWLPGFLVGQGEFRQYHGITVLKSKVWPGKIWPDTVAAMNYPGWELIPDPVANALFPVSILTRLD